jgi:hypothetical protein
MAEQKNVKAREEKGLRARNALFFFFFRGEISPHGEFFLKLAEI